MPMNLVILEKRRELGLTQEQVARRLNVSIPAVSKWENGVTCPDISLLAPLARLLKVDLNTLLCFQEEMTRREISDFLEEIREIVRRQGIDRGFRAAEEKVRQFPHNSKLRYNLAVQLSGWLSLSQLTEEEKRPYEEKIFSRYRRLAECGEEEIAAGANYLIANELLRRGDYSRAGEVLTRLPDSAPDKIMLGVEILKNRGQPGQAAKALQGELLKAVSRVQMLLLALTDAELAAGEKDRAEKIGEKASRLPELLDLWGYNAFIAPLQLAMAERDEDRCVSLLRKLFPAVQTPWEIGKSPLYCRIAKEKGKSRDLSRFLPRIVREIESEDKYDFLKDNREFQRLIREYKGGIF